MFRSSNNLWITPSTQAGGARENTDNFVGGGGGGWKSTAEGGVKVIIIPSV